MFQKLVARTNVRWESFRGWSVRAHLESVSSFHLDVFIPPFVARADGAEWAAAAADAALCACAERAAAAGGPSISELAAAAARGGGLGDGDCLAGCVSSQRRIMTCILLSLTL